MEAAQQIEQLTQLISQLTTQVTQLQTTVNGLTDQQRQRAETQQVMEH